MNANPPVGRRQFAGLAGIVVANLAFAPVFGAPRKTPVVLFVCQFGTVKSATARELFRRRASERGIAVTAVSRGITPAAHLGADTRARLMADGIDPDRDQLRQLAAADIKAADVVAIFNQLPASMGTQRIEDWTDLPSMNDAYPAARADLDRRIDGLLDRLK